MFQECFNEFLFCNFVVAWHSLQLPKLKEGLFFYIRSNWECQAHLDLKKILGILFFSTQHFFQGFFLSDFSVCTKIPDRSTVSLYWLSDLLDNIHNKRKTWDTKTTTEPIRVIYQ